MTAPDSSPPAAAPRGVALFLAPLQREFDRILTDFSGFDLSDMFAPSPRMDLHEADGAIELTAELPGLARDDVRIDLQDDVLTIKAPIDADAASRRVVIPVKNA